MAVSPVYTVAVAALLVASHTVSFSVSNDTASFAFRLTTLCALAACVQVAAGGRESLVPAAVVAALAVLGVTVAAAHQPLAPVDGMLRFLPIPALTALAFICVATAVAGTRSRLARRTTSSMDAGADAVAQPAYDDTGVGERRSSGSSA